MQCELGVGTPGLACIAHRLSALRTHHYDVSLPLIECLFVSVFEWLLSACLVNVMNSTHRQHRPTHLYLPGTLQLFFIYTYKTWILCVCVSVCLSTFFSATKKSQFHEILAQGVIWAWFEHDEARFLNFSFLRILGAFFVSFFNVFFSKKSQPF